MQYPSACDPVVSATDGVMSQQTSDSLKARRSVWSPTTRERCEMTATDFRRIALSFAGAEEGSHMGAVDFRVGGRIFATLASQKQGYGNLMLTPQQQADFVGELPEVFLPIHVGGGKV